MFEVYYKYAYYDVYFVDAMHDAFLIFYDGKFKWVNMDECEIKERPFETRWDE